MDDKIEDIPAIPDGIREAASRGTLILFIGSGVSRIIGGPTWKQFAEKYLIHLHKCGCILLPFVKTIFLSIHFLFLFPFYYSISL